MHWIDWTILVGFTAWIVFDGLKRTKDSHEIEGYFLANRSIPWWAAGISVMATQLSAITMIGTTGQGYNDGMRFIQFYYGLPVAMIILSVTLVPFFYRSGVYTAYEYLERRFDAKTRSFTSLLFLLSRGMSVGAVVSAPAVVLSLVLGWNLTATALAITMPAVVYTMFGGVQAVTWTDVKIMVLIVVGLFAMIAAAVLGLPAGIGLGDGLGHRRRHRPSAQFRLLVGSHQPVHVLVRHDCRAVPLLFVLRDRPEPGAALPHGAIRRGSQAIAADERLLEDPAAGAGAPARHSGVRVLRLQHAAADLQQRPGNAAERGAGRGPVRRAGSASSAPRSTRGARPARRWRQHATPTTRDRWQRRGRRSSSATRRWKRCAARRRRWCARRPATGRSPT